MQFSVGPAKKSAMFQVYFARETDKQTTKMKMESCSIFWGEEFEKNWTKVEWINMGFKAKMVRRDDLTDYAILRPWYIDYRFYTEKLKKMTMDLKYSAKGTDIFDDTELMNLLFDTLEEINVEKINNAIHKANKRTY